MCIEMIGADTYRFSDIGVDKLEKYNDSVKWIIIGSIYIIWCVFFPTPPLLFSD